MKLQVAIITDTSGNLDEGMKKTAYSLHSEIDSSSVVRSSITSWSRALISTKKFDLVHFVGGPTLKTFILARACQLRNPEIGTVVTFSNPFMGPVSRLAVRFLAPSCSIVQSTQWETWARHRRLPTRRMILSGVAMKVFLPADSTTRSRLRARLPSMAKGKQLLLHVGHIKADRNVGALASLQDEPDFQVVLVGSTTTVQNRRLIDELRARGVVVVNQYQQRIEDFYRAADCYVFPTTSVNAAIEVPLSVLEAMSCNLPVLTTPFAALPGIFSSVNGLEFNSWQNPVSVRRSIRRIMEKEVSTRAAVRPYAWEERSRLLLELYEELAERP